MISISRPQGAVQAKDYLSKESYYQRSGELGRWHGSEEALSFLGLQDGEAIVKRTYARILDGFHPHGEKPLLPNSSERSRRAGIDVTFSAPKSLSILVELAEALKERSLERSLREAHEAAVQEAMKTLSRRYAKTRIRRGRGKRILVHTEAIWASFQHETTRETDSREIDPQLHTHNFLMALTFHKDPESGELQPYAMSNEEIYASKMYLGQLYRNALAKNLTSLGLPIEVTDPKQGFFEVKGFSTEQLRHFSGRRTELMEKLRESGVVDANRAKALDRINAKTKRQKRKIDRKALLERNHRRMRSVGIDRELLGKITVGFEVSAAPAPTPVSERGTRKKESERAKRKEHLVKALGLLEERHSTFGLEEMMIYTLKLGLGHGFAQEDYEEVFRSVIEEGILIPLDENVYSTRRIVEAEREVIAATLAGIGSQRAYEPDESSIAAFVDAEYPNMTRGQREMVSAVLHTTDRFLVIQGDAGTGKTYAASAIRAYMESHCSETEVIGLAFTGKAAQSLQEESGIPSRTLHSYLHEEAKRTLPSSEPKLIVVDEAGMAGSLQISRLVESARRNGDKVVFVGDTKQFSSIAAGEIFLDMQKFGVHTVHMSETMRQKSDYAKGIVEAVKERNVEKALKILEKKGRFVESDPEEAIDRIAEAYAEKYPKMRNLDDELIVASRNADRNRINERIRASIGVAGQGEVHTIEEAWSPSGVSRYFTQELEEGMVLIPSGVPGTKNGARYRIAEILDERRVRIEAPNGKSLDLDIFEHADRCRLFTETRKEFAAGDVVVFTRNVTLKDGTKIKNGERAGVERVEEGILTTDTGKTIDLKEMAFVDHGYAITDYKAQGMTAKNVTIYADAGMASMNSFYTQVTRAKENVTVHTADRELFVANLKREAKRRSTLEYTANAKEIRRGLETRESLAGSLRHERKAFEPFLRGAKRVARRMGENLSERVAVTTLVEKIDTTLEKMEKALKRSKERRAVPSMSASSVLKAGPGPRTSKMKI